MLKSLITGMVVLSQMYLFTKLGVDSPSEKLLMLLLIAVLPFIKEPLIQGLEEWERNKTNNNSIDSKK